jgi:methionyl-tRNA formyltransferase
MENGKSKECRIVFMGTPEFAAAQLQALVQGGYNVVAVVTAPDKPAGRGMQLQQSAVKQYAVNQGIAVLQPIKLRDEAFLSELKAFNADLFIVVAFRMLPEVVWRMPRLGTFNLHASLLPAYRGAAPINWAIINGETETGVTTFFINEEIDAGKILLQERVQILPTDNAETLHDKLKSVGSGLVLKTIDGIINNSISAISQSKGYDINKLSTAPKLFKENTRLDWQKTAKQLVNFVRGLSPYPTAWCELMVNGSPIMVKIFSAHAEECSADQPLGTALTNGSSFLKIRCANGYLCIDELQLNGKKRMKIEDFLRGFRGEIS